MNRPLVHMRDQKASLIAMERYRRQQAIQGKRVAIPLPQLTGRN